ncbi:hypothetical protein [Glaciibacter sp. 2TAF33]|uniref:hypothetical protein n=1 Tax=Glaciibacter sp. 2TAF33 TaxID=3233015 RepID=UPI003F91837E
MVNTELDRRATQADLWVRAERAQQIAVLEAVHGFYLAKRFSTELAGFTGWTNEVVADAVEAVRAKLWRLAVIDIAMVNDQNQLPRAASLPGVLRSMKDTLEASPDSSATQDLAQLERIRTAINADTETPLMYVRHVRNKWAGHPSMDLRFDSWAGADKHLSIPLLEEALAVLVRAHQETADLAARSTVLSPLFAAPVPKSTVASTPEGTIEQFPATVAWGKVTVFAELMRESASRDASSLLDQLTSPPGYGSSEDTDWLAGSEHAMRRAAVDRVSMQTAEKAIARTRRGA